MNKNPTNISINNSIAQPPLPPIPVLNTNRNINNNQNGSSIKHFNKWQNKSLSTLSFDMRRVKKIRRLDRKIRSIQSGTSKELQREMSRIEREKKLKLEQLNEAQISEINDSRQRYNMIMKEIEKEMGEKKKTLQNHCTRELQRIKTRIINNHKSCEKPIFRIDSIINNPLNGGKKIKITINRKYSINNCRNDILSVFENWQNEIQFNTKRATRAATKNKKTGVRGVFGTTDLSRIRFHLREDEIKYDLRYLLDMEQEFEDRDRNRGVNNSGRHHSSRYSYYNNNKNNNNNNNNSIGGVMDIDEDIKNAFHSQPSYVDRHISSITNKLGPLNDPCIEDPLYPRNTRRTRVARVNYHHLDSTHYGDIHHNDNNISMYHAQEVHFYDNNSNNNNKTHYTNNDGEDILIPCEERGHNVVIGGNFTVTHGSVVRLNYLGNNTTIDAHVVSIKKNQLSAVTLVGKKRKRIWYKELRIGKINIAPATAYR